MVKSEQEKYQKRLYDCIVPSVILHKSLSGSEIEQVWFSDNGPMFLMEALVKAEYRDIYEFAKLYPDELRIHESSGPYGGILTLSAGPRPPQLILDNIKLIRTTQQFRKPNPYNQEKGINGSLNAYKYKNAKEKFGTIYGVNKPGEVAGVNSKSASASGASGSTLARSNTTSFGERTYSSSGSFRTSGDFASSTSTSQKPFFGASNSFKSSFSTSGFNSGLRKVGQLGALSSGVYSSGSRFGQNSSIYSPASSVTRRSGFDFGRASWSALTGSTRTSTSAWYPESASSVSSTLRERNEVGSGMTNQEFMAESNKLNNVPARGALPPELADDDDDEDLVPFDDYDSDNSDHHFAIPVRKRLMISASAKNPEGDTKSHDEEVSKVTNRTNVTNAAKAEVASVTHTAPVEGVKDGNSAPEKQDSDSDASAPPRKRFMFGGAKSSKATLDLLKLNANTRHEPSKPTALQVVDQPLPTCVTSSGTQTEPSEPVSASAEYSCGISSLYLHRLRWYRARSGVQV